MFLVRNVFHAKPGKAKDLVATFRKASPHFAEFGIKNTKVLTDISTTFWTVVVESEVEDLNTYFDVATSVSRKPELGEAMKGYMDLVEGGFREIYKIES